MSMGQANVEPYRKSQKLGSEEHWPAFQPQLHQALPYLYQMKLTKDLKILAIRTGKTLPDTPKSHMRLPRPHLLLPKYTFETTQTQTCPSFRMQETSGCTDSNK